VCYRCNSSPTYRGGGLLALFDKYDILIDRTTKWGNPFVIGRDGTRTECLSKYREWILTQPHLVESLKELDGMVLGCWCKPLPCHGDILIEMVESKKAEERWELFTEQ